MNYSRSLLIAILSDAAERLSVTGVGDADVQANRALASRLKNALTQLLIEAGEAPEREFPIELDSPVPMMDLIGEPFGTPTYEMMEEYIGAKQTLAERTTLHARIVSQLCFRLAQIEGRLARKD